jgi:Rrf2 family iron-sulfur cluster assembly transcriptional regulator
MISRASEYAIRALTFLSQQQNEDGYYLARDMAEKLGVPAPFLAKILQPLVTRGLIKSQRGRSGGFRLADGKAASDISLYDIVDAEEHLGKIRQCLLGQSECSDDRACPLHQYWKRTSDEYLALLASTTLRDLSHFCEIKPQSGYPCPNPSQTGSR